MARERGPGVLLAQIAKDFGVARSVLHRWMRESESGAGWAGATGDELMELRRRNRLLEEENEVLRRAAAYLSQANLPKK